MRNLEVKVIKFCSLFSGSDGNCQFISSGHTSILVDAGLSGVKVQNEMKKLGLEPSQLDGIFVTHEHIDHIQGVGVLSRRFDIPVYATEKTWLAMESKVGKIKEKNCKLIAADQDYCLQDLLIQPFHISHDASEPLGFNVLNDKKKISLLTDTGCVNDYIVSKMRGCHIVLIESNHDEELLKVGPYPWSLKQRIMSEWGHLSNDNAAEFLKVLLNGGEHVFLGHLSRENNFPELAYKTVTYSLSEHQSLWEQNVTVHMTHRDRASTILEI